MESIWALNGILMTKIEMKTQLIYSTFIDKKLRLKIAIKVKSYYFLVDWDIK